MSDETVSPKRMIPTTAGGDSFIFGAFDSGWDTNFRYIHDTLGFNLWHMYTGSTEDSNGRNRPFGWTINGAYLDSLSDTSSAWASQVDSVLNAVNSNSMMALMMRPKIEWLCYGQRSDYQAEETHENPDLWFYTFNTSINGTVTGIDDIIDTSRFGDGEKVKQCLKQSTPGSNADTILKRLKANTEQCRGGGADFHGDSKCKWFVKPRIRIDSATAYDSTNPLVCKIKILKKVSGFTPGVLKEVEIRANYFLDSTGNYDGRYIDEFNFPQDTNLIINGDWGDGYTYEARGEGVIEGSNPADIQVYWYGLCDMWIDYIRVDNEEAQRLLSGNDPEFERWLELEANIASNSAASYRFYIEWFEFNNIPCITYVNRKLDSISYANSGKHITLMSLFTYYFYSSHVPWSQRFNVFNAGHFKRNFIDSVGPSEVFIVSYPFTSQYNANDTTSYAEPDPYTSWSKIPNTLPIPNNTMNGILAEKVSPSDYDHWLQRYLDSIPNAFEPAYGGSFIYTTMNNPGSFRFEMQLGDSLSKYTGLPFIVNPQIHIWKKSGEPLNPSAPSEVQREPTIEETDMTSNVAVTYGARGLIYFRYTSYNTAIPGRFYDRGIALYNNTPRYLNVFGEEKWNNLQLISQRMKKWEPYIMSFDDANRHSYIYRLSSERSALLSGSYFSDIKTYKPGTSQPSCGEEEGGDNPPGGYVYECEEDRYLQVATFNKPAEPQSKYFMIVNRRCSPFYNENTADSNGGRRLIEVKFDANATAFAGFNNWKIIDLEADSSVITFDKQVSSYLNLGYFMPGQGKLYKLVPVMQDGGTFVTDEDVDGQTFDCRGEVLNDGYDCSIKNSTVSFTSEGKIVMTGGDFRVGQLNTESDSVTLKAKDAVGWTGIELNGCDSVSMHFGYFSGLQDSSDFVLLSLSECYISDIRNSRFDVTSNDSVHAINGSYTFADEVPSVNVLFKNNVFLANNNNRSTVQIVSNSGVVFPIVFDGNNFSSDRPAPDAIFLTNTVGGVIKLNTITGYGKGVNMLSSSMDFYNNSITSSVSGGACNLHGTSGSVLSLQPSGLYYTGGQNTLSYTSITRPNIIVEGALFKLASGGNSFNINSSDTAHLWGYFPYSSKSHPTNETNNCFNVASSSTNAIANVTNGSGGSQITFSFTPYNCGSGGEGSSVKGTGSQPLIIPIAEGYNDTIFTRQEGVLDESGKLDLEIRKHNYDSAASIARNILSNDPDSVQSMDAVQKLYLAVVMTNDTGNSKVNELKSYLEQLIQNNPENDNLIDRAFYYIQKCKVIMGDYSSAIDGFADIVNQNPYTYEALVASWDYSATSVLQSMNTGAGVSSNAVVSSNAGDVLTEPGNLFELKSFPGDDPKGDKDRYDKTKFSKEDRKVIKNNIVKSFRDKRTKRLEEISEMETTRNDPRVKKELRKVKALEDAAILKKAETLKEHIKRVNSDIVKVFGQSEDDGLLSKDLNTLPTEFELSQNFPNPFNPTTKIQYALPHDGKVQLVIYDILGREVVKLVNNEFRTAGRYISEFNGSRLASGVYFYRIMVNEGKDFNQVKKMVLVK